MFEDILVVTIGWGKLGKSMTTSMQWIEARDAAKCPAMHRKATTPASTKK